MAAVTVIVPMYNAAATIERCVKSVLAQTMPDYQLLVVDNASTDGSADICRSVAAGDPRVRIVREEKRGVSAARNRGLAESGSEYIYFLDADDAMGPGALQETLSEARAFGADIVCPGICHMLPGAKGWKCKQTVLPAETARFDGVDQFARTFAAQLPRYSFLQVFMLYRRDLFFPEGEAPLLFDEGLSLGEDVILNLRLYARARRISQLNKALHLYYHYKGENLSTRYRADMVELKARILGDMKAFLRAHGCFDEAGQTAYYTMYVSDAMVMAGNLFKAPGADTAARCRAFAQVLAVPDVQALLSRRRALPLPPVKRLFLSALAGNRFRLTQLGMWIYQYI